MPTDDSNPPSLGGDTWFRDLIACLPDGLLVVDQDGMIRYANPAAQQLFRQSEGELIDTPIGMSIKLGEQPEIELPGAAGPRFAEIHVSSAEWHGQFAWLLTLRDITERKLIAETLRESEERFKSLLQNVPRVAIQGYGLDGRVHYWNKASAALYGYNEQEALAGNLLTLIIPPEMRDAVRDALNNVAAGGEIDNGELSLMCKDGSRVSVYSSHSVVRRPGQAPELFCIDIDLTERDVLGEQLRQSQRLESVGQLTGGVAHDFNNLLTVILGNAELLTEELASDSRLQPLASMVSIAAQRGAELTRHLLAFARRQPLDPKTADLNQLAEAMQPLIHRALPENIALSFIPDPDLGMTEIDAGELDTALLNLAVNARDAMPDGGKLTIETANALLDSDYATYNYEVTPGEYVMICVSDTGTGMTPDTLQRAFEPFFTTKGIGKGSGLGLSMVFGFTKQSGGHIKIYSELGEGTAIKLYFPRVQGVQQSTSQPETELVLQGEGEHILIAEDDDLVLKHLDAQLRSLGYRVTAVTSGPEALASLKAHGDIELLLTDIIMPGGMNGRELADRARAEFPSLKVLYTSGYTENAMIHHGRLESGVELLSKPYTRLALANKLRQVIKAPTGENH